jgi:hypothetical protein
MLSPDLLNPFLVHRADDTVTVPLGHVPDLHSAASRACLTAINQAAQVGQGLGLVMIGEAGSGKSHLLANMRQRLASVQRVAFAAIRMNNAFAGRLWRPLRSKLVDELLRPYPTPTHGANGLLRILKNQFPRWAESAQTASGGMVDWLLGRRPEANLAPHLLEFQMTTPLDGDLVDVLPQLGSTSTTRLAMNWLRGTVNHPDHLQRLGLSPHVGSEAEQEAAAQEVVLSLLRLAGRSTLLTLSFDEVEAIQGGNWDTVSLRSFATLATTLLGETGPRIIITSLRPNLYTELSKTAEKSNVEKFGQFSTHIAPLNRDQMNRVVQARLDAVSAVHAERARHPTHPFYPFTEQFLDATFQTNKRTLTPRSLIVACHTEFERLKGITVDRPSDGPAPIAGDGKAPTANTGTSSSAFNIPPSGNPTNSPSTGTPGTPTISFNKAWEKRRDIALRTPAGIQFDHMMATGLPWLAGLLRLPLVQSEEKPQGMGDVNLFFLPREAHQNGIMVSFCNQQPQQLWRRLDRLLSQWKKFKEKRERTLVVLRSETEQVAEGGAARLTELQQLGAQVLRVPRQALAELAAFQGLMTSIGLGEVLNPRGGPVTMDEYNAWAAPNLSSAVKEFLDQVFRPHSQSRTVAEAASAARAQA